MERPLRKQTDLETLQQSAGEAADMLKLLANESRLLILCQLAEAGEMSVGELTEAVALSQSALSQHLARLRAENLVATRREAQTIHYRIADPRVGRVLNLLKSLYCP
jgi:DNA-binding transcriptional ArsR family regulator